MVLKNYFLLPPKEKLSYNISRCACDIICSSVLVNKRQKCGLTAFSCILGKSVSYSIYYQQRKYLFLLSCVCKDTSCLLCAVRGVHTMNTQIGIQQLVPKHIMTVIIIKYKYLRNSVATDRESSHISLICSVRSTVKIWVEIF